MKATELMIGDWVQNTNGNKGKFSAMIYQGYRGDCDFVIKYAENSTCYSESKLICPIPLTAEILEKNGWQSNGVAGQLRQATGVPMYSNNFGPIMCLISVWPDEVFLMNYIEGIYDYRQRDVRGIMIHYVHELQHALRLCGQNELADNFKI